MTFHDIHDDDTMRIEGNDIVSTCGETGHQIRVSLDRIHLLLAGEQARDNASDMRRAA
jgi:hypothetical protein